MSAEFMTGAPELVDSLGMFLHNPIYSSGPDAK